MKFSYEEYYRTAAPKYNELRLDAEKEINKTVGIIKKYVSKNAGKILEAGCGTGRFCERLKKLGYDIIGLDKSDNQLAQVPKSVTRIHCSITKTPFMDESFAGVLFLLSLHQLSTKERLAALAETHRILDKKGYLIIKTCSHNDLKNRGFTDIFPTSLTANLKRYPDIPELCENLSSLEYRNIEIINTITSDTTNVQELIRKIKNKHNSTLAMIPEKEFNAGCKKLETYFGNKKTVTRRHRHTILVFQK